MTGRPTCNVGKRLTAPELACRMLAEVSDMQLQLEDLCEEDAAKIRRAAAERGMAPREFFRLLKERQADTVAKAAADRLARELATRRRPRGL